MFETWNSFYSTHAAIRTVVGFAHIIGLVAGGGCAITADLATIIHARDRAAARSTQLHLLERTHAIVVGGLIALTLSGLLLFAADIQTYLPSRVFWIKMTLLALLIVNGALMLAGEKRVARGEPRAWTRLHHFAVASLVLWGLITLAGAALPNIG
jgi:uncharacterized membrane protein